MLLRLLKLRQSSRVFSICLAFLNHCHLTSICLSSKHDTPSSLLLKSIVVTHDSNNGMVNRTRSNLISIKLNPWIEIDFQTCRLSRYSELALLAFLRVTSVFFCKVLALFQGESNIKNVCFTRLECLELKICSFSKPGIPSFLPLESGATHDPIMSIEPSRIEFQSTSIHRV